jgi:hypothetical protein
MSARQSKIRALRGALLLTLALGLNVGAAFIRQSAFAGSDIVTDAPPPPDRAEHAPSPRDGYVWAAHWVVDRWAQVGAQWHYIPGHWEH